MKLIYVCILSLVLIIVSRLLFTFGTGFIYDQEPIDYAHWSLLLGSVLASSFIFAFPNNIISKISSLLLIVGIVASIGMCVIDFIFWSYDELESREAFFKHMYSQKVIWTPFMEIGPALFYAGLTTYLWQFIKEKTGLVILGFIASAAIGVGQMLMYDNMVVLIGLIVFSIVLIYFVNFSSRPIHSNKNE